MRAAGAALRRRRRGQGGAGTLVCTGHRCLPRSSIRPSSRWRSSCAALWYASCVHGRMRVAHTASSGGSVQCGAAATKHAKGCIEVPSDQHTLSGHMKPIVPSSPSPTSGSAASPATAAPRRPCSGPKIPFSRRNGSAAPATAAPPRPQHPPPSASSQTPHIWNHSDPCGCDTPWPQSPASGRLLEPPSNGRRATSVTAPRRRRPLREPSTNGMAYTEPMRCDIAPTKTAVPHSPCTSAAYSPWTACTGSLARTDDNLTLRRLPSHSITRRACDWPKRTAQPS